MKSPPFCSAYVLLNVFGLKKFINKTGQALMKQI